MSTLKLGWGGRIAVLYGGFVILIVMLVTGSMRQEVDLVAEDYYQQEIAYQEVLDAGKNQATLSTPVSVHANETTVTLEFPPEFRAKLINGSIMFYAPSGSGADKLIAMNDVQGNVQVRRAELQKTNYTVKISWEADGKKYYQESEINLF